MKSPLSVLADIWPAPSQRPYTRDEQRFYLEWVVVAVLARDCEDCPVLTAWSVPPHAVSRHKANVAR